MHRQPGRLVFIDETSVKTNMTPLRGRSPCGERLRAEAPFGKWRTQTFVAGLRCHELVAPWIIEGAMDGAAFDVYVRTQLAPCLEPGDAVILDNLNVHKSPRAAQAIAERGAWLLFLPKYYLRPLHTRRMLELLQSCRLRCRLIARRSSMGDRRMTAGWPAISVDKWG